MFDKINENSTIKQLIQALEDSNAVFAAGYDEGHREGYKLGIQDIIEDLTANLDTFKED